MPEDRLGTLGLSTADVEEWQIQHGLLKRFQNVVRKGKITQAEIAKLSGSSRTRVTTILNDALEHVSTDLLIRILCFTRLPREGFGCPVRQHRGIVLAGSGALGGTCSSTFEMARPAGAPTANR